MKKKGLIIIVILIVIIGVVAVWYFNIEDNGFIDNDDNIIDKIKSHYGECVKTNKEATLYSLEEGKYYIVGSINKDVIVDIEDTLINEKTKYFLISDLNYYIKYEDVSPVSNTYEKNDRYKNYLLFNENIVTKDITHLYDDNGLVYTINHSLSLPIIIKDTNKYYVEYAGRLLNIHNDDVKETIKSNNTTETERNNIRTLAYHFIYEPGVDTCDNDVICHPVSQFESHMKYIYENDYFTLSMDDLELFLDGKIRIPKKSIVITIDDGLMLEKAIPIIEKYKIRTTIFVITSWVDINTLKSDYIDLESHTDALHVNYKCPDGNQGGALLCYDKDVILKDLKTSQEKLGGSIALAYPFYDYNDRAISLLKEAGFKMGFIGIANTKGIANKGIDKYKIPRMTIWSTDTMEEFISYLQ